MKKIAILLSIIMIAMSFCACNTQKNDSIEDYSMELIQNMSQNKYEEATIHFDSTMKSAMTTNNVKEFWEYLLNEYGQFKEISSTQVSKIDSYDLVTVTCQFEKGSLNIKVVFNSDKTIAGINSDFALQTDNPEIPNNVSEKEITVGENTEWSLGATLSYQKDNNNTVPAVIFVHGSGPNDRNETVGGQALFRDLAWGLSSKGIATLRYDKRTYSYSQKIKENIDSVTVEEESIDDVKKAIEALKAQKDIKIDKIYIAGHSLGGSLLPRIAQENPEVSGYIFLAANARPLEDLMIEQYTYIFSIDPNMSDADKQAQLDNIQQKVNHIKSLTPDSEFTEEDLLGATKNYWLSLKGYEPAESAKSIDKPMLFLQGEKDYQVTMQDFKLFQEALSDRTDVTFISYPDLNHMFTESKGEKAVPTDYNMPLRTYQKVIDDIAQFIQ